MDDEALFRPTPVSSAPARDVITKMQICLNNLATELRSAISSIPEMAPPMTLENAKAWAASHQKLSDAQLNGDETVPQHSCVNTDVVDEEILVRAQFLCTYAQSIRDLIPNLPDSTKDEAWYKAEISELQRENVALAKRLHNVTNEAQVLNTALKDAIQEIASNLSAESN